MPFTSIIDHQALLVLLNHKRNDEARQLTRLEQIGRVSRTPRTPARYDVEMRTRERLIHEHTARLQHLGEHLEQRAIEKADADDGVTRCLSEWKRARVRRDADNALVARDRSRDGSMHEVYEYYRSAGSRDGLGVTTGTAGDVDDQRVAREPCAALADPRGRRVVQPTPAFAVPRFPCRAVAARIESFAHR